MCVLDNLCDCGSRKGACHEGSVDCAGVAELVCRGDETHETTRAKIPQAQMIDSLVIAPLLAPGSEIERVDVGIANPDA